jgi:hypothetical protein
LKLEIENNVIYFAGCITNKPSISGDSDKVSMEVDDTDAIFSNETALVNDPVITVNSLYATVGGSDTITSKKELFAIIENVKPILI